MFRKSFYAITIALSALLFLGCSDAFIGLGDKVDLDPPSLAIDQSHISSGDYVSGVILLTGSASDDIGVASVKISLDGGSTFQSAVVSDSGRAWSASIDTTQFEDGEKEIILRVTDTAAAPKTDEDRILLYFDNTPPVVVVKEPSGYLTAEYSNAILSLKGEASDPYRIRAVYVNLIGGSGTLSDVSGTNTWSCTFESSGTGSYLFEVIAEDYAGNRSSHFYHYDDILEENDSEYITPEDVFGVESGTDMGNLTTSELEAIQLEDMSLSISLDLDNPVIGVSNPDPDAQVFDNIMPGTAKFIGSVSDDDGVDTDSMEIRFDGGPWESVETVSGSGRFVTWEHTKNYGASGDHYFQLKVDDIFGVSETSPIVNFRINVDAAKVDITSPGMSAFLDSSDFTLSGTAEDIGGGVTDLQISLDNGSTWADVTPSASLPQESLTWTYEAASVDDGLVAVKMRASDDNCGTWSYSNTQFTVDTTNPICSITSPKDGVYVNGQVTLRGTCTDNNQLDSVQIKIGDDPGRPWIEIDEDELYSWTYDFDSADFENGTDGSETSADSGIFAVNCYVKAVDKAGNTKVFSSGDHVLYIDNELDKPVVSIISPGADASVGGSILVTGTSADDDGAVYAVYMQIDVNTAEGGVPNFSDTVDLGSNGIDFDGSGDVTVIDESHAYMVEGTAPWGVTLNTAGQLYNTEAGHSGDIYIRVYAVDKDGGVDSVEGDVETLHFKLDDTIPLIDNLSPETDSYVKGTFTIEADVTDNTQIKHLEVSYDGGTSYHYIIKNGVVQSGYSGSGSSVTDTYAVSLPVDTSNIPDVGSVTSDDITVRLKVTDDTNYQSQETLVYYVDNNQPTGWMIQDTSDIYGNGGNALFYGYANDTGTVSGVEQVILYIERDGLFYDQKDGSTTPVTSELINGVSRYFPSDADYRMVIDSTVETLSGSNSDGDGLAEELNVGADYEWKAQIESANIPDGIATLHYVVYDRAGNRVHGSQSVFIKNDKPEITSLDVGYDLDNNGSVEGGEIFPYTGEFKARSRLYFNIGASDGGGISEYRVYEGTNASGTLILSAASGDVDISGMSDGVVSFFCQVTDGDGITDEQLVLVDIDNVDDEDPKVILDSLTRDSVVDGHLEEDGDSLYDGTDADVSGTIEFTGRVTDDQGIEEFRLDLDGSTVVLAAWTGGFFVSQDSNFTIDSQTFGPGSGHEIDWTYTWNSADVTGIAAENVTAMFTADDFAPTANQNAQSLTFDVVPYISDLETSLTSSFDRYFSRTAQGVYPVWVNSDDNGWETITINGYNLNPVNTTDGNSDVRLSRDGDALDGIGTKVGKGLAYSGANGTFTSLTADMRIDSAGPVDGNGYLTVFTNGIPSINNINDNGGNSEADHINPNLVDDREIQIWDLRLVKNDFPLANNAVYPSMSMNGDTPEFAYQNNAQGWGISLYNDGTAENYVYENWDLFTFSAIDHNGSGDHGSLYDINVVNGNYGDYNSGNYGGIMANFYENVPGTSWNYWSYRYNDNQIWLENLVDEQSNTIAVLNRYRYPDIMMKGDTANTDVFYTVYDQLNDVIIYRHFEVGTDSSIDDVTGGRMNDTGTAVYTNLPQYEGDGSFPEYNGDSRFQNSNTTGRTPDGRHELESVNTGEFTAVAATDDGSVAAVAWYDATGTGKIRLMYNTNPDNDATWETIGADSLIDSGHGGEYLDMRIDSGDNIHIAYYDNNNGDLRYIYIPVGDFSTDSFGTMQNVIVDSYFDVGEKLTLELDSSDRPFMAYKGVNRSGKVAWLTGALAAGVTGDDEYTGSWEIAILPTQITNSDSNRFCIGVDTSDLPVAGFTNGGIEYIRMLADLAD